jgi:mono/diheme cytochrome c family protein
MKSVTALFGVIVLALFSFFFLGGSPNPAEQKAGKAKKSQVERGKYLVSIIGCNDCHSPKIFTKMGPIPDTTRLLSGHPSTEKLADVPAGLLGPNAWGAVTNGHLTAWVGPWGTSFTRNLTPDMTTGIGSWTPEIFMKAIRTGKDMGEGRDILPPMPWQMYRNMTDDDLKAVFAYLQSLPPIDNAVPDPITPTGEKLPTLNKAK